MRVTAAVLVLLAVGCAADSRPWMNTGLPPRQRAEVREGGHVVLSCGLDFFHVPIIHGSGYEVLCVVFTDVLVCVFVVFVLC